MRRRWIPELKDGTLALAKSAFEELSSNEDFQTAVCDIYLEKGQPPGWIDVDLFIKILVQELLTLFDSLDNIEASHELKEALKQAKELVESKAKEWRKTRPYACTLLLSLTLRKLVQKTWLRLEIEDRFPYIC